MRFYKVHFESEQDSSEGFRFFTVRAEADRAVKQGLVDGYDQTWGPERIEVNPTKIGILNALNTHGGHPDNG